MRLGVGLYSRSCVYSMHSRAALSFGSEFAVVTVSMSPSLAPSHCVVLTLRPRAGKPSSGNNNGGSKGSAGGSNGSAGGSKGSAGGSKGGGSGSGSSKGVRRLVVQTRQTGVWKDKSGQEVGRYRANITNVSGGRLNALTLRASNFHASSYWGLVLSEKPRGFRIVENGGNMEKGASVAVVYIQPGGKARRHMNGMEKANITRVGKYVPVTGVMAEMAGNSVICQLADAEGKLAGNPVDIPQDAGPRELTALLNAILNNEERLPYAFYIDDREVSEPLGEHLRQHKAKMALVVACLRWWRGGIAYTSFVLLSTCVCNLLSCLPFTSHYSVSLTLALLPPTHLPPHPSLHPCCLSHLPRPPPLPLSPTALAPTPTALDHRSRDCTVRMWSAVNGAALQQLKGHGHWVNSLALSTDYALRTGAFDHGGVNGLPATDEERKVGCGHRRMHRWGCGRRGGAVRAGGGLWAQGGAVGAGGGCGAWAGLWGERGLRVHLNPLPIFPSFCPIRPRTPSLRTMQPSFPPCTFSSPMLMFGHSPPSHPPFLSFPSHPPLPPHQEKARVRYEAVKGASGERLVSGSDDFTMVLWHPAAAMQPNSPLAAALKAKLTGHQQVWWWLGGRLSGWVGGWSLLTTFPRQPLSFQVTQFLPSFFPPTSFFHHPLLSPSFPNHPPGLQLVNHVCFSPHPCLQLVNHVCFSPDGRWLASGSFDKSVKLWDGVSGRFIASFRAHVSPIYQLCWSADSRLLVSASKDSTLKVWDLQTRKVREDLPGHADEVFAVDWSPDGTKVASGGKDRVLKLWMT
ncbi:unnamed protein product [Closterium sp. NIES-54]